MKQKIMTNSFSVSIDYSRYINHYIYDFRNLLWKFGASESTIKYATDYLGIYLIGTVFVQIALE